MRLFAALETWIIKALQRASKGEVREDRVGVWVVRPERRNRWDCRPKTRLQRLYTFAQMGVLPRHIAECGAGP